MKRDRPLQSQASTALSSRWPHCEPSGTRRTGRGGCWEGLGGFGGFGKIRDAPVPLISKSQTIPHLAPFAGCAHRFKDCGCRGWFVQSVLKYPDGPFSEQPSLHARSPKGSITAPTCPVHSSLAPFALTSSCVVRPVAARKASGSAFSPVRAGPATLFIAQLPAHLHAHAHAP